MNPHPRHLQRFQQRNINLRIPIQSPPKPSSAHFPAPLPPRQPTPLTPDATGAFIGERSLRLGSSTHLSILYERPAIPAPYPF